MDQYFNSFEHWIRENYSEMEEAFKDLETDWPTKIIWHWLNDFYGI